MKVILYVEGGGDSDDLQERCRRGFRQFLMKAGFTGRLPRIVACGSRNNTYKSFCTSLRKGRRDEFPILLVDAEATVESPPWNHLKRRDGWNRPDGAIDEHAHLMVQVMESWFLADRQQLKAYFGQGFVESALPGNLKVEEVAKETVFQSLKMATRNSRKGEYGKGDHSFDILGRIDPGLVTAAVPHAKRLKDILDSKL